MSDAEETPPSADEPEAASDFAIVDDTPPPTHELDRESAFDKLRIENFTALRMGAIRARSWWLIALCMSTLVSLDMTGKAVIYFWVFRHIAMFPLLWILLAIVAALFATHAFHRAKAFKREIDTSALPEPATPPDFSTLDNGSERWKHLENVR